MCVSVSAGLFVPLCFCYSGSHAGFFERSNCSDHQTSEGQGSSGAQHREEGQGYSLGRKIVSEKHTFTVQSLCVDRTEQSFSTNVSFFLQNAEKQKHKWNIILVYNLEFPLREVVQPGVRGWSPGAGLASRCLVGLNYILKIRLSVYCVPKSSKALI